MTQTQKNQKMNELCATMNVYGVPEHIQEGIAAYIVQGRPPGDFLRCVFSNMLMESFGRADSINKHSMVQIVSFLYNEAPSECLGSKEIYENWIKNGGLIGVTEAGHGKV